MSSRRSSAVNATADSSAQTSKNGSPAIAVTDAADDVDMASDDLSMHGDEEGKPARPGTHRSDSRSVSRSGSAALAGESFIQRIPQLDIAFLHAVSSHRPLGPHKHFNLIPIIVSLDRTIRQIGAQARDRSSSRGGGDNANDEETSDGEGHSRRSRSQSRRVVKREDTDDNELEQGQDTLLAAHLSSVDGEMIRQRLEELYDVAGLEELEDQGIDADEDSPFSTRPRPTLSSAIIRKALGGNFTFPPSFGFGGKLEKVAANESNASPKAKMGKQSKSKKARAEAEDEEDEDDEGHVVDFELGPWEEYEDLIAPRRLKGSAPDDEEPSESDGELSGYSGAEATGQKKSDKAEQPSHESDKEDAKDEDDEDEDEDEDEDDEDDEEEQESEEEADDTHPSAGSKRKASSGATKRPPPLSRQKRTNSSLGGVGGSSTSSPVTPTSARASRSAAAAAAAAKPRRSGRR